jgi:hypothetical protein
MQNPKDGIKEGVIDEERPLRLSPCDKEFSSRNLGLLMI